jgi:hypothetical protein
MSAVGFEPTRTNTSRPERDPLDHSGKPTPYQHNILCPVSMQITFVTTLIATIFVALIKKILRCVAPKKRKPNDAPLYFA